MESGKEKKWVVSYIKTTRDCLLMQVWAMGQQTRHSLESIFVTLDTFHSPNA